VLKTQDYEEKLEKETKPKSSKNAREGPEVVRASRCFNIGSRGNVKKNYTGKGDNRPDFV